MLRAAAGSDVISFADSPLRPLPEVASQHEVLCQPEVEFSRAISRRRVRELNVEERLVETRRTVILLILFSIAIFLFMLLTSLTQSLDCQRAGVIVLVVWVAWLLPAAYVWISDVQSRLKCVCYCHVTCRRPSN